MTSKQAKRYVMIQFIATVLFTIALSFYDRVAAYSGLTGGLIAALSTAWFAVKVFGIKLDSDPVHILRSFYLGEINKILMTVSMFIAAFVLIEPVNAAALMAVYFLVYMLPSVIDFLFAGGTLQTEQQDKRADDGG